MRQFTEDQLVMAVALNLYNYNVDPGERAAELFPGRHPGYLAEWTKKLQGAFLLGEMSQDTTRRYLGNALARYGEEAESRIQLGGAA